VIRLKQAKVFSFMACSRSELRVRTYGGDGYRLSPRAVSAERRIVDGGHLSVPIAEGPVTRHLESGTPRSTRESYTGALGASAPEMTPPRLGHVYRIAFRTRNVPECFLKWRLPTFANSKRVIWVRTRKQRDELLCCDRLATWASHKYRQCKLCGRTILGMQAQIRVSDEEGALLAGEPVSGCGRACIK
jgi:hypothetical protein